MNETIRNRLVEEEDLGLVYTALGGLGSNLISAFFWFILASMLVFALSPYLIEKLFPTFIDSIPTVKVMSLAVIPSTIAAMLTASLLGKEKSRILFTAGLVYLAYLIAGLIIMGKIMGVLGLALTLVVAKVIQAIYLSANKSRK